MAEAINHRLAEMDMLEQSVAGLQSIIGVIAAGYNKPPLPVAVTASSMFGEREIAMQQGNVVYPHVQMIVQRVSENITGYNNNLRRLGVSVVTGDKILTYRLLPVTAYIRIRYLSNDNADILKFVKRWLLRQKDTQFSIVNNKLEIGVKVRLPKDLSLPEGTPDGNPVFALETECEIDTYIGEIENSTILKSVVISSNLFDSNSKIKIADGSRVISLVR